MRSLARSGLAYLTHIFGCAWYYLAASSHSETTWLSSYDDGSGATADVWVCYLYAVYWALTTLTTIGCGAPAVVASSLPPHDACMLNNMACRL